MLPAGHGHSPRLQGSWACSHQCPGLWDTHTPILFQGLATVWLRFSPPCRTWDFLFLVLRNLGDWRVHQPPKPCLCSLPLTHTAPFNFEDGPRSWKTKNSLKILFFVIKHTWVLTSCWAKKHLGSQTKKPGNIEKISKCIILTCCLISEVPCSCDLPVSAIRKPQAHTSREVSENNQCRAEFEEDKGSENPGEMSVTMWWCGRALVGKKALKGEDESQRLYFLKLKPRCLGVTAVCFSVLEVSRVYCYSLWGP